MLMKDMYEAALQESEGQPVPHVCLTLLDERDVPNQQVAQYTEKV